MAAAAAQRALRRANHHGAVNRKRSMAFNLILVRNAGQKRRRRIRQHVNPFTKKFQGMPVVPPCLRQGSGRSLHLDIGCASGNYLLKLAKANPLTNYVGLEIRKKLVDDARRKRDEAQLGNVDFLFCNVIDSEAFSELLRQLPERPSSISVFHPDPLFKKRQKKRRVVTPALLGALGEYSAPGAQLFIQSDVQEAFLDMARSIFAHPNQWYLGGGGCFGAQSKENALGIPTDREMTVSRAGLPIWRAQFSVQ